jgi:CheY-like chemotaxis protein
VPRILVADDNTNIQKMVSLAFEERGIDVVAVGNGEAAVRRIPDANPDLVLADVFMPVRNGYEVCEFVKKDTRFAHTPVILLVGAFDPLDEKEARRVGADGVLKKPFVPPDPLIAMVMSALEKNPKIAAELAKAKETPIEPPAPPLPALEIPAKTEPKPLPDFPEPTPEEAAAIYGFGKGVRSLDDEEDRKAGEPRSPVAESKEEESDEFDGASTATDWRRKSAMDLEIPENVASEPAFSYGRDLSPITFPSERDVPPRRVRVPEESVEQETPAKRETQLPQETFAKQETVLQNEAPASVPASTPELAPVDDYFKSPLHEAVQPAKSGATSEHAPKSLTQQAPEADFGMSTRTSSWMDLMSSTSSASEYREKHWSEAPTSGEETPSTEAQASSPALAESAEPSPASPQSEHEPELQYMEDEQPKKKSWFTDAVEAVREAVHSVVQDSGHEEAVAEANDAIQEDIHAPAHEPAPEPSPTPLSSVIPVDTHEFLPADTDERISYRDPDLEEPPPAHVTPEPLLVKDEPTSRSEYGKRSDLPPPVNTFAPPPPPDPLARSDSDNGASAFFEPSPPEPEFPGFSERIPTAPPPNREALAQIPFLSPPPPSADSGAVDDGTVDAVVQKVLERLEPQLHDLLSKGLLKPLVENMLHDELSKKNK